MVPASQNVVRCRDKVFFSGLKDVWNETLWIAVDKRKPSALNVNHHSMAWLKGVQDVA